VKVKLYQKDGAPIEVEAWRVRIECGQGNLAVFPAGGNIVRLKGGLR
jgi:hypothetical protein